MPKDQGSVAILHHIPEVGNVFALKLIEEGHKVHRPDTVTDLLQLAEEPDIILLAARYAATESEGRLTIQRVEQKWPDSEIYLLSASHSEQVQKLQNLGYQNFIIITKDLEKLIQIIHNKFA